MRDRRWSRRDLLKASTASAVGVLFAEPLKAATDKLFRQRVQVFFWDRPKP